MPVQQGWVVGQVWLPGLMSVVVRWKLVVEMLKKELAANCVGGARCGMVGSIGSMMAEAAGVLHAGLLQAVVWALEGER